MQQKIQMETQSKMQIEQAKSQYEVQKLNNEKELKLALNGKRVCIQYAT